MKSSFVIIQLPNMRLFDVSKLFLALDIVFFPNLLLLRACLALTILLLPPYHSEIFLILFDLWKLEFTSITLDLDSLISNFLLNYSCEEEPFILLFFVVDETRP